MINCLENDPQKKFFYHQRYNLSSLYTELKAVEQRLDRLTKYCHLPFRSGPVASNLDDVLKEQGIHTQAYHGRPFVGNHCHKYLKTPAYKNICESVVRKTVETTNNSDCHAMANDICRDFKTLNFLYVVVHAQLSHTQPLAEKGCDTEDMQNSIDKYMTFQF